MITEDQKERLTTHGQVISNLDSILNKSNSQLCIEWWEVGKELSDSYCHTGHNGGNSNSLPAISSSDMKEICACLGLSTRTRARDSTPGGAGTVSKARNFYRKFPDEESRNSIITRYKTWGEITTRAFLGKPPSENAGTGGDARSRSARARNARGRPSNRYPGRLITPHNTRVTWDHAINDFMASTGEDYPTSREILFRVLTTLDYPQLMRRIWQEHYAA